MSNKTKQTSGLCDECAEGDHRHHRPHLGGICIGCVCSFHAPIQAKGGARLEIIREDGSREVSQSGVPPVTREELISIAKEAQSRVDELLAMLRDAKAERDEARESVTNLLSRVHDMHADQRELSAALRRVGCQDQGSCGESELDGLCFVCSALENCGSAS